MCGATDALEQKEEAYLRKVADRYAPPAKKAPVSPIPDYIRTLLQQIALGVLVLMVAALVAVYRAYRSDADEHVTRDLLYAACGCIAVVFVVNALQWLALACSSRSGARCVAFLLLLLSLASILALEQLETLQFTQKRLQEHVRERQRAFSETDVATLVDGGAAPSLLHRFVFDGPTHFLRWLQRHCAQTLSIAPRPLPAANATVSDSSGELDESVDTLAFYDDFWRPRERKCVDTALSTFLSIESVVQSALTALLVVTVVQLALCAVLFQLDAVDADADVDPAAQSAAKRREQRARAKRHKRSRRQRSSSVCASPQTLLALALALAGLVACALSASLGVSCDVPAANVRWVLGGVFAAGGVSFVAGVLLSCCRVESTVFVQSLLLLLAVANVFAIAKCVVLQEQLEDASGTFDDQRTAILHDAYDLIGNQTCAIVTDWRAHTCEHQANNSSGASLRDVTVGDPDVDDAMPLDAVCRDELTSLLRTTLAVIIAWLSAVTATAVLLSLLLLAPVLYDATAALARAVCVRLCCLTTSGCSSTLESSHTSNAALLTHASRKLQDARELYLSTLRVAGQAALEAETAAFNTAWATMTGRSASDISASTVVLQHEFDAIVRTLVLERLTQRCKMDVSVSVSRDGTQLFVKIAASDNLLMTALCDANVALELADFVDPGPAFWQTDVCEIKTDARVLEPHAIKQKLKHFAATDVIPKREAEWFPSESLARVSARVHALSRAARVANGTLQCANPYAAYAPYVPQTEFQYLFKKHPNQLELPGIVRRASVLRTIDSLRLARRLIDAELNVDRMVHTGLLTSFLCLHSASRYDTTPRDVLAASWVFYWRPQQLPGEPDPATHWWRNQLGRLYPFRQPLRAVRDYFGECIAFYFAWLACYTQLLVLPAVGAVAAAVYAFDRDDPVFAVPRTFYRSGSVERTRFSITPAAFTVGLSVILWGLVFAKYWERQSVWYQLEWGTAVLDDGEDVHERPGFWGERRLNPVTHEVETHYSSRKRLARQLGSLAVLALLMATNVVVVIVLVLVQGSLVHYGVELRLAVLVSCGAQACVIQASGDALSRIAHSLSEWENHQHAAAFELSVIAKVFALQAVNTYAGLLLVAFVDLAWFTHVPGLQALAERFQARVAPHVNALVQLETLVLFIFVARIASHVLSIAHRILLDALATPVSSPSQASRLRSSESDSMSPTSSSVEDEHALDVYRGAYQDYTQIVVQFGLVVMVASVFPLAPVLALVECALELRLDALDLCRFYQRPAPDAAAGIGPWASCIQLLLTLALATAFGLVAFTADNFAHVPLVQRASVFLVATLGSWLVSEVLWLALPSTSAQAAETQARNAFVVERYFGADGHAMYSGSGADDASNAAKTSTTASYSETRDSESDGQSLDVSLEHYRERVELLRRLNVTLRRHDELPTFAVGEDVVVPVASAPSEDARDESEESARHSETRQSDGIDDQTAAAGREEEDDDAEKEEEEEEEMIIGYFKPVLSAARSASARPVASLEHETAAAADQEVAAPVEAVAVGIPIAEDVLLASSSASSSTTDAAAAAEGGVSDPNAGRLSKRPSFLARMAKRASPRASSSSSASSSGEALPSASLSMFRRPSKLSPALLAAALELEAPTPRAASHAIEASSRSSDSSASDQRIAAPEAFPVSIALEPHAVAATATTPLLVAQSVDVARQYSTKELEGVDAINEAVQRSQFDFSAEDGAIEQQ